MMIMLMQHIELFTEEKISLLQSDLCTDTVILGKICRYIKLSLNKSLIIMSRQNPILTDIMQTPKLKKIPIPQSYSSVLNFIFLFLLYRQDPGLH